MNEPQTIQPPKGPFEGTAIACGILGFFSIFFGSITAILGFLSGLVALANLRRDSNKRGRRLVLVGMILNGFALIATLVIAILMNLNEPLQLGIPWENFTYHTQH